MAIKSYTSVAASNISLFPEGMAPSAVNDGMRQVQADISSWYKDAEWIDRGDSGISRASASSFKITSNLTGVYTAGRRLKLYDATTLYGVITSSSYSAPDTTVNVTTDSGNLTTSLTSVAVGILSSTNRSYPSDVDTITVSGAAQFKGTLTTSGAAVLKTTLSVEGAATLSGNVVMKGSLSIEGETTFSGTVNFLTAPIFNNLAAAGTFTASGSAVFKTTLGVEGEATVSGTLTLKTVVTGNAVADQSAMELATATNRIVSPGRQQFHPSASKAWLTFDGTGTIAIGVSYNMTSITDNGVGDYTTTIATDFSGGTFVALGMASGSAIPGSAASASIAGPHTSAPDSSNFRVITFVSTNGVAFDPQRVHMAFFGDQ